MIIDDYFSKIKDYYKSGIATEHTYREALQTLIENLVSGIRATNEPKRQACGAPDYIITKKEIPLGWIEAKDVQTDLDKEEKSEQMKRYRDGLENLILTDYTEFRFYQNGKRVTKIDIGFIESGKLKPKKENYVFLEDLIKNFCIPKFQTIKSSEKLAKMMAGKAKLMQEVIFKTLNTDNGETSSLRDQLEAFQKILIHDMTEESFADIYAQTIAYGLFAARLHDPTLDDFSRQEAMFLVPKSNPFLRQLFTYIAGPDLDDRIVWIVDALAEVFRACDVKSLLKDFGKTTQQNDPMIHFYETFLAEYNPKLRKSRGVYYTPEPVVNFIVRAVEDILKTEFNLPDGLADTSKVKLKVNNQGMKYDQEVHRVQILDPAAGTGTFLSEIIKHIYKKFENQQGIWSNYVEEHLIPRLHGFEILMASYAMCHLKLELLLKDTGFVPKSDKRLQVYLTNSLEEPHEYTGTLFAKWLLKEANEANKIKQEKPIMIVLGNPPYSVSSSNKGKWIDDLISDYKKNLDEKSYSSLSDDYVKFIRYSEYFVKKNGSGVVAMITNNSFLDGIVFRRMRECLLNTFSKIFILDLHGNAKKKETAPDGSQDQNVFDIMQGVSIILFVRAQKGKRKCVIFHEDIYGKREYKYEFLFNRNLKNINWTKLKYQEPNFFFVKKDFSSVDQYDKGFKLDNLFLVKSAGIKTHRDAVVIGFENVELKKQVNDFFYSKGINNNLFDSSKVKPITYRPFDNRLLYFDTDLVVRHRKKLIKHSFNKNVSLLIGRQTKNRIPNHFFISSTLSEMKTSESSTGSYHFSLYLYLQDNTFSNLVVTAERIPNLDKKILRLIESKLNLEFKQEKSGGKGKFSSIDLLDYIYAVLYSPYYRERFKEFLKIDFPRIPYPEDKKIFWKLVEKGGELRQFHLMESPILNQLITSYSQSGDNLVEQVKFEGNTIGKVWINKLQYFDKVPRVSWEFYIGGYQPAQKWLKDRKRRQLSFDDILHYQKIIVALKETDRIMKEIDKIFKF